MLEEEISALLTGFDKRLAPILEVDLNGRIEFVVTANGNRSAFAVAAGSVQAAPALDGWRFIALKPRRALDLRQSVSMPWGAQPSPWRKSGWPWCRRGAVDIALLMPVDARNPKSAQRCRPLARTIVLALIGEEDLAARVIDIEVFPLSVLQPNSSTLPLGQIIQGVRSCRRHLTCGAWWRCRGGMPVPITDADPTPAKVATAHDRHRRHHRPRNPRQPRQSDRRGRCGAGGRLARPRRGALRRLDRRPRGGRAARRRQGALLGKGVRKAVDAVNGEIFDARRRHGCGGAGQDRRDA